MSMSSEGREREGEVALADVSMMTTHRDGEEERERERGEKEKEKGGKRGEEEKGGGKQDTRRREKWNVCLEVKEKKY